MKTQDKNLGLMDDIMGALNQADEWQEIQKKDPMITSADNHFNALAEQAKALLPEKLYDELYDAHFSVVSAMCDAGILFGIHVADAIKDVASRPADLSRYVLNRMKRGA